MKRLIGLAAAALGVAISSAEVQEPGLARTIAQIVNSAQSAAARLTACRSLAGGIDAASLPRVLEAVTSVATQRDTLRSEYRGSERLSIDETLAKILSKAAGEAVEISRTDERTDLRDRARTESRILDVLQRVVVGRTQRLDAADVLRAARTFIRDARAGGNRTAALAALACCPVDSARAVMVGAMTGGDAVRAQVAIEALTAQAKASDASEAWGPILKKLIVACERRIRERAAARAQEARSTAGRRIIDTDSLIAIGPAACAAMLARTPDAGRADAARPLIAATRHSNRDRAVHAIDFIARAQGGDLGAALTAAATSTSPRVRVAACRALRHHPSVGVQTLAGALSDPYWQVRVAAIRSLREVASADAIDALIDALARADGRERHDSIDALGALTGQRHGGEAGRWVAWWREHRAHFRAQAPKDSEPPESTVADGPSFFGIPVRSRRVAFVLHAPEQLDSLPSGVSVQRADEVLDEAGRRLERCAAALGPAVEVSVSVYGDDVRQWRPKPVPATDANVAALRKWIRAVKPAGGTNVFEALVWALRSSAKGRARRLARSAPDTVFFVMSGWANRGGVVDSALIVRELKRLNRGASVRINTIAIGATDPDLLGRIARETGGRFVRAAEDDR